MRENESHPVPPGNGLLTLVNSAIAVLAIFFITRSSTWALACAFLMAGSGYFVARAPSRIRLVSGIYLAAAAFVAAFFLSHRSY